MWHTKKVSCKQFGHLVWHPFETFQTWCILKRNIQTAKRWRHGEKMKKVTLWMNIKEASFQPNIQATIWGVSFMMALITSISIFSIMVMICFFILRDNNFWSLSNKQYKGFTSFQTPGLMWPYPWTINSLSTNSSCKAWSTLVHNHSHTSTN